MEINLRIDRDNLSEFQRQALAVLILGRDTVATPEQLAEHAQAHAAPSNAGESRAATTQASAHGSAVAATAPAAPAAPQHGTSVGAAPAAGLPAAPPVPSAPTAVPPSGSPAGAVETDASGLPWDHRIHSEARSKTSNGHWRKKRGVDDVVAAHVEAELRTTLGAPAAPPPPPPPAASPAAMAGDSSYLDPAVAFAAPPAPAAAPPAPAAAPPANPQLAFMGLVGQVSAAMAEGKLQQAEADAICQEFGVQAFALLAMRADLVPAVAQRIGALIASRG